MSGPLGNGGERQRFESEKSILHRGHDLVEKCFRRALVSDVHTEVNETCIILGGPFRNGVRNGLIRSEGLTRLHFGTQTDIEFF